MKNISTQLQKNLRTDLAAESEPIKRLFALVHDDLSRRTQRSDPVSILPAGLFSWARKAPSLLDIRQALIEGKNVPEGLHQVRPGDPLYVAFQSIAELREIFGISDGADVCRLLGFICQTVFGSDENVRRTNRDIAATFLAAARQCQAEKAHRQYALMAYQLNGGLPPTPPSDLSAIDFVAEPPAEPSPALGEVQLDAPWMRIGDRRDETSGGLVSTGDVSVWYATHIGPQYAQKPENQDAAYALDSGRSVVFAISDGVSTSVGSRIAAASIVKLFCEGLVEKLRTADQTADEELLTKTARTVHDQLNRGLTLLLSEMKTDEWTQVKGASTMNMDSILRLAENTLTPKNRFWAPLLAATLIGGCIERIEGKTKVSMIRIGDGIAELIDKDHNIVSCLAMDSGETEVTAVVSPGPTSERAVSSPEYSSFYLPEGSMLFLSSDGLARGHSQGLVRALQSLCDQPTMILDHWHHGTAMDFLLKAAHRADEAFRTHPEQKLFSDNLSLIAIAVSRS